MTQTSETTAPDYIDAIADDARPARFTRRGIPAGMFVDTRPAAEIAALAPAGVLWESFGHVNGRECFGHERYVAAANGDLHIYASDGSKSVIHPAARRLRFLAR